jgi:hypothetical protein
VSAQFVGALGAAVAQPVDEFVRFALCGRVEGGEVVPADPVDVGASLEQVLGDGPLSAVACALQGASDLVVVRRHRLGERLVDPVDEAHTGYCVNPD